MLNALALESAKEKATFLLSVHAYQNFLVFKYGRLNTTAIAYERDWLTQHCEYSALTHVLIILHSSLCKLCLLNKPWLTWTELDKQRAKAGISFPGCNSQVWCGKTNKVVMKISQALIILKSRFLLRLFLPPMWWNRFLLSLLGRSVSF